MGSRSVRRDTKLSDAREHLGKHQQQASPYFADRHVKTTKHDQRFGQEGGHQELKGLTAGVWVVRLRVSESELEAGCLA